MIILFTDGSCSPNPGPGGFAVIHNGKPVVTGRDEDSTNIRMEGKALIEAMKYSDGQDCQINTDSEFWVNVITKWAPGWRDKGWKKSSKGEIQNLDLVKEALETYENSNSTLVWVKAHVGNDGNELADHWANEAREGNV